MKQDVRKYFPYVFFINFGMVVFIMLIVMSAQPVKDKLLEMGKTEKRYSLSPQENLTLAIENCVTDHALLIGLFMFLSLLVAYYADKKRIEKEKSEEAR